MRVGVIGIGSAYRVVGPVTACMLLLSLIVLPGCGGKDWEREWQEIIGDNTLGAEQLIEKLEAFLEEEPPLKYASEARFSIGFTWAETLKNYGEARRWFKELLEVDPDCVFADDAEWMLENMEKDIDELLPHLMREESPPPP